jgi:hypothetical protein
LIERRAEQEDETAGDVSKIARQLGINLDVSNAFRTPPGGMNVIGPDDDLDNPWSACPPVYLHGFLSGTLMKLVAATMAHLVKQAIGAGQTETSIARELDAYCGLVHRTKKRCSNVELGSHPLTPMPHGISDHVLNGKSMDGNKRMSIARLMHGFVATTNLFTPQMRTKHCEMYELAFQCREDMYRPVHRGDLQAIQKRIDNFDDRLIKYMVEFSPSKCCSEKHHQYRHYAHHRLQLGCTAFEMAFEHTYAVGFKKQVLFTNKSALSKSEQTATKHYFRTGLRRLTSALKIRTPVHTNVPAPTSRVVELAHLKPFEAFPWPDDKSKLWLKRKAATVATPLTHAATSMRMTIVNRQHAKGSNLRLTTELLRAECGGERVWVDDLRVHYNDAVTRRRKIGFGKAIGFFMDAADAFHVGIQWYKIVGRQSINATTRMTKVELIEDSYDFVPAGSIRNGALLMPLATPPLVGHPQQYHVIQSHREAVELRSWALAV